jgi:hypothetical protein
MESDGALAPRSYGLRSLGLVATDLASHDTATSSGLARPAPEHRHRPRRAEDPTLGARIKRLLFFGMLEFQFAPVGCARHGPVGDGAVRSNTVY